MNGKTGIKQMNKAIQYYNNVITANKQLEQGKQNYFNFTINQGQYNKLKNNVQIANAKLNLFEHNQSRILRGRKRIRISGY